MEPMSTRAGMARLCGSGCISSSVSRDRSATGVLRSSSSTAAPKLSASRSADEIRSLVERPLRGSFLACGCLWLPFGPGSGAGLKGQGLASLLSYPDFHLVIHVVIRATLVAEVGSKLGRCDLEMNSKAAKTISVDETA